MSFPIHTVKSVPTTVKYYFHIIIILSTCYPKMSKAAVQKAENSKKVVYDPGNDDIVVETNTNDNEEHGITNTYQYTEYCLPTQKCLLP